MLLVTAVFGLASGALDIAERPLPPHPEGRSKFGSALAKFFAGLAAGIGYVAVNWGTGSNDWIRSVPWGSFLVVVGPSALIYWASGVARIDRWVLGGKSRSAVNQRCGEHDSDRGKGEQDVPSVDA